MQIADADLAKIRLKCLELVQSGDTSGMMKRAAALTAWVVRDRTARTERTPPAPEAPPPSLPDRLASFKLGMEEMARRIEAAGTAKPGLIEKVRSTLSNRPKVK